MKKMILGVSFIVLFICCANAQSKTIRGKVTSAKSNSSLPGVSVILKGTVTGTVTDLDGNYVIENIPSTSQILVFSFIGMKSQEQEIGTKTIINVVMQPSAINIDEIVVTALGISKNKKALGYAVTSFSGEDIADSKMVNPVKALQGKVAGIDIASAPSPGGTQNVIIRGASSFTNNQPLYIIDGMPLVNNTSIGEDRDIDKFRGTLNNGIDFGSGINALDPNAIENMQILKGAAATALYGSRAANGVVIITTKSGRNTNGKMQIDYNGSYSISRIGRIAKRQNEFGQGWSGNHDLHENGNWGPKYTGEDRLFGFRVDNSQLIQPFSFVESRIRDFYDLGQNVSNAISLSGGNENTNYLFGVSLNSVDGVYPDDVDTYDRITLRSKGEHKWKSLTVSSSVNYANEQTNSVPSGQGATVFQSLWEIPENYSIVDMKDYRNKYWNLDNYFTPYGVNPYFSLFENGATQSKNKVFGKVQFDLDILPNLKATYKFGGDFESAIMGLWQAKINIPTTAPSYGTSKTNPGSYKKSTRNRYELNHDAYLIYTRNINKWNVNALAGISINERGYSVLTGVLNSLDVEGYYRLNNGTVDAIGSQYSELRRLYGILANVDIDYDRLLYFTVTARNDKSSTLPTENNSYFYPGITASVDVSELLRRTNNEVGTIDFAKIRIAYGWTGNDANVYGVYPTFIPGLSDNPGYPNVDDLSFPLNGINSWMVSNKLGSPNLAPEITKEFEIGTDMYFFKNRIGLEFSYYNKLTEGLIEEQPLDPSTGYTSIIANIGDVRNKGFELMIFGFPVKTSNFEWKIQAIYTQNKNKVEKLAEAEVNLGGHSTVKIVAVEGKEMGLFKTEVAQTTQINGKEYTVVDGNGMPVASPDLVVLDDKSVNEKFSAGLTNTFSYKNISLGATLDLHYGGYMYSRQKDYMHWTGSGIETTYNDRNPFIIPNSVQLVGEEYKENTTPVASTNLHAFYSDGGFEREDNFIIDRSYLKLREVKLIYNLPKIAYRLKLANLKASCVASNILLWTPAENQYIDPETTSFGTDIEGKFGEFGAGPTNQVYTVGLTATF